MMAGLVGSIFLREVPRALAAGVASGEYSVYGSIIRSGTTGRIVGHLQETSGLTHLVNAVGPTPLGAAAQFATGVVQIAQNEQIKTGISHLELGLDALHQLGVAQLALGATGIGVSVAGFAVISRKIDGVKAAVDGLAGKIEFVGGKIEALRADAIASELDDVRGLARLMDEGWRHGGELGTRRWHKVAEEAPRLSARFERRAGALLSEGVAALPTAEPMLDALALVGSLRVAGLAALGEISAAQSAAAEQASAIEALTGRIGAADIARSSLSAWGVQPGIDHWPEASERARADASLTARRLRDREAAAVTRAAAMPLLERKAIHPRDWLAAAREEGEVPLLLMVEEH